MDKYRAKTAKASSESTTTTAVGEKKAKTEFLSEQIESSCFKSNLNETFEPCIWIRENCLYNINKKILDAHFPHGVSEHGEFTFVAKTRSRLSNSNRLTDQIGQVKKSSFKLEICHMNKVYELESFVLLNFRNSSCFKWCYLETNKENIQIPRNALRLGYDTINQSVIYAGRTCTMKNSSLVGRVTGLNYQLIVPVKSTATNFSQFEILCLKPSPESLKHLCRNKIRHLMAYENSSIKKLKFYLEPSLIGYVKFRNTLRSGATLKRNESLVSKNGKFKLSIESDGRLFYFFNENRNYLFLNENVEALWFYELKLVVCFEDLKSVSFLTNFDQVNTIFKDSKVKLCNRGFLHLISPYQESKIVIQFRDDIQVFWNSTVPKYDFFFFFQINKNFKKDENDDESESSDDSSDSADCTSSDDTDSDE